MAGSTRASPTVDGAVVTAVGAAPLIAARPARRRTFGGEAWRRFRRHRLALVSAAVLLLMMAAVALGPLSWQTPINDIDFAAHLHSPSLAHPLGTDDLGQDLLARMLYGGRISLAVGIASMLVAVFVGTLVGAVAGVSRGAVDNSLVWLTDLFLSLPQLPILLLIIYLFRPALSAALGAQLGTFTLIVAVIGLFRWMSVARLVRAQFLSLREKEFVEAARALGASTWRQVVRHILPNALGPIIVAATIEVANAIIYESTLSFLGLGFPPDTPSWGRILYDAQQYLDIAPHWALTAGGAIFLTVLAISFIGDGLRDALDPRKVL
jgi:peptide/nickel transport system permease protein